MKAAKSGKSVAAIEQYHEVGGGATHWATIPSKALRAAIQHVNLVHQNPIYRRIDVAGNRDVAERFHDNGDGTISDSSLNLLWAQDDNGADITWNDGHFSSYPSWYLRENCMCAECVEEFTGERKVGHGNIPSTIERTSVSPVGNYALNFEWSDGHANSWPSIPPPNRPWFMSPLPRAGRKISGTKYAFG